MTAKSRSAIATEIASDLADNTAGDISAADLRGVVTDLSDSMHNPTTDGTVVTTAAIGVSVQAYDADLTTWAGITPGSNVGTALAVAVGTDGAFVVKGGALGTPSSGTLTNATGLPVAGITASTSTALGVGSIELGHASDTTIARVSAGVASIEGVTIATANNTLTLTNKTLTNPDITIAKAITETPYGITDGAGFAIDPTNGPIQTVTLGANRTPTVANFAAGQSVIVGIDDGTARTITWTTIGVTWTTDSAAAPTLATTGYTWVVLWRVGSTYYGARVGNNA